MLEPVIWVDVAIVVAGAVAAVVLSDVLGHRGLPTWPVGLIALAVFIAAGLTYSAWLAAAALGIGCGALIVSARVFVQTIFERRRHQSDSRRKTEEQHAHRRSR